ncbi:MAG: helix-turn-helix domain-containing protein [Pseudomonadota bacterium]|nr:helix-turn-helix domain-containing protein [Pseudomonadota bacterium]
MRTVSNSTEFGTLVRCTRKAQGLTQEQLAAVAGVGPRFVRELEAGKGSCQMGRALLVLGVLGLRINISGRSEDAS